MVQNYSVEALRAADQIFQMLGATLSFNPNVRFDIADILEKEMRSARTPANELVSRNTMLNDLRCVA